MAVVAVGLSACSAGGERLPYGVHIQKFPALLTHPLSFFADLDNTAHAKFIRVDYDPQKNTFHYRIDIADWESDIVIRSLLVWDDLIDVAAMDVSRDGRKEIVLTYRRDNGLYLRVYDPLDPVHGDSLRVDTLLYTGPPRPGDLPWDGGAHFADPADLNGDGYPELILTMVASYAEEPRGILAYDLHNRRTLWRYLMGTAPIHPPIVADVDGDGWTEILFGTAAPSNGNRANGLPDDESWLVGLRADGAPWFTHRMGGAFTATGICLLTDGRNGAARILSATRSRNYDDYAANYLAIREIPQAAAADERASAASPPRPPGAVRERHRAVTPPLKSLMPFLVDKPDGPRITLIDAGFGLIGFDTTLSNMQRTVLADSVYRLSAEIDLTGDRQPEYVFNVTNSTDLAVLDRDFNTLARIPDGRMLHEISAGRGRLPEVAVLFRDRHLRRISLYDNTLLAWAWKRFAAPAAILLTVFLGGLLLGRALRRPAPETGALGDAIWSTAPVALARLDASGRVCRLNRPMTVLVGDPGPLEKPARLETVFGDAVAPLRGWIQGRLPVREPLDGTLRMAVGDAVRILHLRLTPLGDRGTLLAVSDGTAAWMSEKTALWLSISRKLAHQIKTPLNTLRLSLGRIRMETREDPALQERFDATINTGLDEVQRIRNLTDNLLRITRIENPDPRPMNLAGLLERLSDRYRLSLPEGVEFSMSVADDLPDMVADPDHLEMVFANLIDNGAEAIAGRGEVMVTVGVTEALDGAAGAAVDRRIAIDIADSGEGMDADGLERLFVPFATTRENGSGLGMLIVRQIVEDHGGSLAVDSTPGIGTRVAINLPLVHPVRAGREGGVQL